MFCRPATRCLYVTKKYERSKIHFPDCSVYTNYGRGPGPGRREGKAGRARVRMGKPEGVNVRLRAVRGSEGGREGSFVHSKL
jgi:hypothetical protein